MVSIFPVRAIALQSVDEVTRASAELVQHLEKQAEAIAPERPKQKTFQYAGHYRDDHKYSPFHLGLNVSLKQIYSRATLEKIVVDKGWLNESTLHRLDTVIVDVWADVVWLKIPARIPYKNTLCRFISKKDFLEVVISNAQRKSEGMTIYPHRQHSDRLLILSTSGSFYELTPTIATCECSCKAQESLSAVFEEDPKLAALLKKHPVLRGILPDKHVFALWSAWGVENFQQYQKKRREWDEQLGAIALLKSTLKANGVSLVQDLPGHFNVSIPSKKLGTVDQKFDIEQNSWWINQRQITLRNCVPGDRIQYSSLEEAALGLAKLCQVIEEGDRAAADLFGGGWEDEQEEDDLRLMSEIESEEDSNELVESPAARWLSLENFT